MREAFVLEVGTVMPQNSVPWQQLFTFKRMDAFDQGLESKVDALAEEPAFVRELVRRLAAAHSVLFRGE